VDLEALLRVLRRALRDEVAPHLAEMDERQEMPESVRRLFTQLGLLALVVPAEHGGPGLGLGECCRLIEEIATVDASCAVLAQAHATALRPLLLAGSDDQRRAYFREVVERGALFAFCLTEPDAGSDALALTTRASPTGSGYRLSGVMRILVARQLLGGSEGTEPRAR